MYEQRGFGFDGRASPTTGTIVVGEPFVDHQCRHNADGCLDRCRERCLCDSACSGNQQSKQQRNQGRCGAGANRRPDGVGPDLFQEFRGDSFRIRQLRATQQSVILVTDGLPTQDLNNLAWPPLGSAAGIAYGVTATFNADGSLNTSNDQALKDAITKIAALKTAGINVYVIGMGAGVNSGINPLAQKSLTAMAVAGGTGAYFPANQRHRAGRGL